MARQLARRSTPPAARPQKPAALRPGARPGGGVRRTRSVKRASAGLTPVRAGALLALLIAAGGLYGLVASDVFAARTTVVSGNTWTSEEAVLAALDVPDGQNVFTVRTTDLESRLATLPAVSRASVTIALPDELRVDVAERVAVAIWRVGDRRFLVDADGLLFGEPIEDASSAAVNELPMVDDRRIESRTLGVGSTLDPVSLDAAFRLGSLRPADVGSTGDGFSIRVDDVNGFVLRGEPAGWRAIFGFYTPTLRTPDLIPGQVRLLRSFMGEHGEANVLRVILANDRSGTYVPRATPKASPSPSP